MNCAKCEIEVVDEANYCFNCGFEIVKIKKCTKCNAELIEGGLFCHNCGSHIKIEIEANKSNESYIKINIIQQYKSIFEYVGSFCNGYAPVIDRLEDPKIVGYVSEVADQKLIDDCSENKENSILLLSRKLCKLNGSEWVGSFYCGSAYVIKNNLLYEASYSGKINKVGRVIIDPNFKHMSSFLVEMENHERFIIDFTGKIIVKDKYLIVPFPDLNCVYLRASDEKNTVGLFSLKENKLILKEKYEDIQLRGEFEIYNKDACLELKCENKYGDLFGLYYPNKNILIEPKYPAINFLFDFELMWKHNIIFITTKIKKDQNSGYYVNTIVVTDMNLRKIDEITVYGFGKKLASFDAELKGDIITIKYENECLNSEVRKYDLSTLKK